jgi:hypothetical protein
VRHSRQFVEHSIRSLLEVLAAIQVRAMGSHAGPQRCTTHVYKRHAARAALTASAGPLLTGTDSQPLHITLSLSPDTSRCFPCTLLFAPHTSHCFAPLTHHAACHPLPLEHHTASRPSHIMLLPTPHTSRSFSPLPHTGLTLPLTKEPGNGYWLALGLMVAQCAVLLCGAMYWDQV